MKSVLLALLLIISDDFVSGQTTNVNTCTGDSILPEVKFYAYNKTLCIDQPCPVIPGSDISLDITFKSPKYLENIKPNIKATSLGVSLDYPLFQDDACVGIINTYCPIVQDEVVEYSYNMHVLSIFPEVTVTLEFTIVDKDTSSAVVCFSADIKIVKS